MTEKYKFIRRYPKQHPRIPKMFRLELERELNDILFYARDAHIVIQLLEKSITNNHNEKRDKYLETALLHLEHLLMKTESINRKLELTDVIYDTSKHETND